MNGLIGTHIYAIDHKGRLGLPPALRRGAGKAARSFVLVKGFEGCLALYTEDGWEQVEARLEQLAIGRRKARAFQRMLYLNATRVTVDAQGRITIPPALMDRAGLGKEAVLLGQNQGKIEIWDPQRLNAHRDEMEPQFEDLAEDVLG